MEKLEKLEYDIAEQFLTEECSHLPLLEAFVLNEKDADIYIDNRKEPKAAFVLSKTNWLYSIGDVKKEFQQDIIRFLKEEDREYYIWFGVSSEQVSRVSDYCNMFEFTDYPRFQFRFNKIKFLKNRNCMKKVNPVRINENNIDKAMQFSSSISDFYETKEHFLKEGFGFLLLDEQRIIGQVVSAGISKKREVEMDIHTAEEYRERGLGTGMGAAFIEHCLQENLIPKWDCMVSNTASINLALRLCFESVEKYPVTCLVAKKK